MGDSGKTRFFAGRESGLDISALEAIERRGRELMTALRPLMPGVQIEHRLLAAGGFPADSFQFTVRGKTGLQVKDAVLKLIDAACIQQGRNGFKGLGMHGSAAWLKADTVTELVQQATQKPDLAEAMTAAMQEALAPKKGPQRA